MGNKIKVLITGAGSSVGQAIYKSLKISSLKLNIITADINELNANLYRSSKSFIIPKVEKKDSLRWFVQFLRREKIDVLMIGSEYEILFFSKYKDLIERKTGTIICVSNYKICKISDDKLATQIFLKNNDFDYLKTYKIKNQHDLVNKSKKLKFPMVLKDQRGTSSRNVFIIKRREELKKYYDEKRDQILQEYISSKNKNNVFEFTSSFFKTIEGKILGPYVGKRKLVNGRSWIIETKNFTKIKNYIKNIAKKIDCIGSFNIQLQDSKRGPIAFEFNSRFSGTTAIRANYNFNEPEMFLKNFYLNKKVKNPKIRTGMCFVYNEEIFVNSSKKNLKKNLSKGYINKWF